MREAQQIPVNRCFDGHCSINLRKENRKERVKALLAEAARRKAEKAKRKLQDAMEGKANRFLNGLLKQIRHRGLIDFLPLVERRVREGQYPKIVLKVLIERIKRNQWSKLSPEDQILVTQAEASLEKQDT